MKGECTRRVYSVIILSRGILEGLDGRRNF